MGEISQEIKEKYALLDGAKAHYGRMAEEMRGRSDLAGVVASYAGFFSRLLAPLKLRRQAATDGVAAIALRAVQLGGTVADLEYSVKTHEIFKLWFGRWLRFHIVISFVLYLFLFFHFASEICLG